MTEGFIQNVQFDLFSVELVIEDTATLSLAEDFIQNVQFDIFSVQLVIGETATLLMAENYVTIREVFVDNVKVEPNEKKQIFLPRGVTSHNQLTDKNSEATYQHVDTTITKETLVNDDKVAIFDSETGKVVLTDKTNVGFRITDIISTTDVWSSSKTSEELNKLLPLIYAGL